MTTRVSSGQSPAPIIQSASALAPISQRLAERIQASRPIVELIGLYGQPAAPDEEMTRMISVHVITNDELIGEARSALPDDPRISELEALNRQLRPEPAVDIPSAAMDYAAILAHIQVIEEFMRLTNPEVFAQAVQNVRDRGIDVPGLPLGSSEPQAAQSSFSIPRVSIPFDDPREPESATPVARAPNSSPVSRAPDSQQQVAAQVPEPRTQTDSLQVSTARLNALSEVSRSLLPLNAPIPAPPRQRTRSLGASIRTAFNNFANRLRRSATGVVQPQLDLAAMNQSRAESAISAPSVSAAPDASARSVSVSAPAQARSAEAISADLAAHLQASSDLGEGGSRDVRANSSNLAMVNPQIEQNALLLAEARQLENPSAEIQRQITELDIVNRVLPGLIVNANPDAIISPRTIGSAPSPVHRDAEATSADIAAQDEASPDLDSDVLDVSLDVAAPELPPIEESGSEESVESLGLDESMLPPGMVLSADPITQEPTPVLLSPVSAAVESQSEAPQFTVEEARLTLTPALELARVNFIGLSDEQREQAIALARESMARSTEAADSDQELFADILALNDLVNPQATNTGNAEPQIPDAPAPDAPVARTQEAISSDLTSQINSTTQIMQLVAQYGQSWRPADDVLALLGSQYDTNAALIEEIRLLPVSQLANYLDAVASLERMNTSLVQRGFVARR